MSDIKASLIISDAMLREDEEIAKRIASMIEELEQEAASMSDETIAPDETEVEQPETAETEEQPEEENGEARCSTCEGRGYIDGARATYTEPCPTCGGKGRGEGRIL